MNPALLPGTPRPVPWSVRDFTMLWVSNVAGLALVIGGWLQASGALTLQAQIPWVNAAVSGIIVAGGGNVAWLLAGRRGVGKLQRRVADQLRREEPATPPNSAQVPAATITEPVLLSGPGMTRFHRPDCLLVVGKKAEPATLRQHARRKRQSCDVCRSGEPT